MGCFQLGHIFNSNAISILAYAFCCISIYIYIRYILGELLGHSRNLPIYRSIYSFNFSREYQPIFWLAVPIYIPTSNVWESPSCFSYSPTLSIINLFTFSHSGYVILSQSHFDMCFMDYYEAVHLIMLYWLFGYSLL